MFGLFFEMQPKPGHLPHYFDHVARLQPALAATPGLIWLDRFSALDQPDLILSHQIWETAERIVTWRGNTEHRKSQMAGMTEHFADYRIRVGARRHEGSPAQPGDLIVHYGKAPMVQPGWRDFKSVNHADSYLSMTTQERATSAATRAFAISRDYGLRDRAQAPARDAG
jgi:heme-degrading monooxygenase HmoA